MNASGSQPSSASTCINMHQPSTVSLQLLLSTVYSLSTSTAVCTPLSDCEGKLVIFVTQYNYMHCAYIVEIIVLVTSDCVEMGTSSLQSCMHHTGAHVSDLRTDQAMQLILVQRKTRNKIQDFLPKGLATLPSALKTRPVALAASLPPARCPC